MHDYAARLRLLSRGWCPRRPGRDIGANLRRALARADRAVAMKVGLWLAEARPSLSCLSLPRRTRVPAWRELVRLAPGFWSVAWCHYTDVLSGGHMGLLPDGRAGRPWADSAAPRSARGGSDRGVGSFACRGCVGTEGGSDHGRISYSKRQNVPARLGRLGGNRRRLPASFLLRNPAHRFWCVPLYGLDNAPALLRPAGRDPLPLPLRT